MIRGGVRRLARMDATEIRWRAKSRGHALMDRVTTGFITPVWRREHLLRALAIDAGLARVRDALAKHDWAAAHAELSAHFAHAPQRFVAGPETKAAVIDAVRRGFPGSSRHAVTEADRILVGKYDLLGYSGLRFDPAAAGAMVDWHLDPVHGRRAPRVTWSAVPFLDPSCGDHKIIWELNRHQHWLTLGRAFWLTGDAKYRDRSVRELRDWLDANPPRVGINWASMLELAFRSLSWVWALGLFVDGAPAADVKGRGQEPPWTVDLLLALDLHLAHIERHLSHYFSPNTHLLGEALGLYVCGLAVPELAANSRRADTGRRILLAEIGRQIGADGGHLERSTHYHRYTLDFYLLALIVARINRDPAAAEFERAVSRIASAARLLADDRGRLPHIGDDDGGMLTPLTRRRPDDVRDSLAIAATLLGRPELRIGRPPEEVHWLVAHASAHQPARPAATTAARRVRLPSGALDDTGYYVSRTASSDHLVIDGGPHGYQNAGHAHADALSLTFSFRGRPLLIDPGTGSYTSDPDLRERLRSTALHNTVTIDGRPSSVSNGPFHWSRMANCRVDCWQTADAFDFFDGMHDGYHPLAHRRCVLSLHGDLLIVADIIEGSGLHTITAHWHVAPGWSVVAQGSRATLRCGGQHVSLTVADGDIEVFTADRNTGLGWQSPAYGRVEPATTLRVVRRGNLPMSILTVIELSARNALQAITPEPTVRTNGGVADGSGFHIARDSSVDYLLIAESAGAAGPPRAVRRIGALETDARMLFYRSSAGRPVSQVAFVDGSLVRAVGGGLRLEAPRRLPHYFADLESASTTPPDHVR
jgi:uncharacterized heparinase superfamily protein